jgi:hypothetical protein
MYTGMTGGVGSGAAGSRGGAGVRHLVSFARLGRWDEGGG